MGDDPIDPERKEAFRFEDEPALEQRPRRPSYDDELRRERRRDYYDDERDDYDEYHGFRTDPRQRVLAPGMALIVVGILGIVFGIAMLAIGIILPIATFNQTGPNKSIGLVYGIVLGIMGIITLVGSSIVTLGGRRMRKCQSWGLSLTAAILVTASIVILGLWSVFVLPFGIWALVVLSNSDVKRAFERNRFSLSGSRRDPRDE